MCVKTRKKDKRKNITESVSSVLVFNLIIQRDAPDLGESMIDTAQIGLTVIVEPD